MSTSRKSSTSTASVSKGTVKTNGKQNSTALKRHSVQGASYYDELQDECSIYDKVKPKNNASTVHHQPAPASFSPGPNNLGGVPSSPCIKPPEPQMEKMDSLDNTQQIGPTRPMYYDPAFDAVPTSLERTSLTSEDMAAVRNAGSSLDEGEVIMNNRRKEMKSIRSAKEISENEGTDSDGDESEDSENEGKETDKSHHLHNSKHPKTSENSSSGSVSLHRPSKMTKDAIGASKHRPYDAAKDGAQRGITTKDDVHIFIIKVRSKSAKTVLKQEHKSLIKKERHISEFCKNLQIVGRNRHTCMVNFNEFAPHLPATQSEDATYIHASCIRHTYGNFIMAQGPTRRTMVDFYKLIWFNDVRLVVCVDPLVDPRNCVHYFEFNAGRTMRIAKRFTVQTGKIIKTHTPFLTIYELYLCNKELKSGATGRRVSLVHYSAWEVLKPPTASAIIDLMKLVRSMEVPVNGKLHPNPILVHGSCGARRSGVFVLAFILCNQLTMTKNLSIVRTSKQIRRIRYGILRNHLSFILLLETILLHASQTGFLDPAGKVKVALVIIRRERCRIEGENRFNLHSELE